ncbi:MAG: hypothetical protein Kow0042_24660 [Calditrichia bacterium]
MLRNLKYKRRPSMTGYPESLIQKYVLFLFFMLLFTQAAVAQPLQMVKTIPVGKGPDALFLTPDENFLYVANVEDNFVSVIDTRKDTVVQTIQDVNYPWGFSRLGRSHLVAVSGWDKGVYVIDSRAHQIVRQKRYEQNLGGIASSSEGKTLFVVGTAVNQVFKIDAATLEIVDSSATGNGPDGVGISGDDSKIYVTNTRDGTISIIRLKNKKTQLIRTGGKPELIHYNHDHSCLFISNFLKNKIHILDTGTDKIIHEITGLDGPEEAVLSPDETRLYVVNFNRSLIYVYDAKTFRKLPQEYRAGTKPIGVMPVKKGNKLYVSNYGDNSVGVMKLQP